MQKFIPFVLAALLAVGCKGGESTMGANAGGSTGSVSASADGTYNLKFAPKQGDKVTYAFSMDAGAEMTMTMDMTLTCEKVEGDKSTVVSTFDNISMKMGGKEAPAMATDPIKKMKSTSVMDTTGKVLSTKVEGGPAGSTPEANGPALPGKPVKVGDTWEGTSKMSGVDVKSKYKLTKVEGDVAFIEGTMEGLPNGLTTDGPVLTEIDMKTGFANNTVVKMKMKGPDGKDKVMTMSMKRK